MAARLSSGASVEFYETLDSTSAEAKRRAGQGARGPLWIVALEQTAGYGRRGAAWKQAPGDVAATLLFDPRLEAERLGELSFVAALATVEALAGAAPGAPFRLKWPNDILADGGKIAGLLLELVDAPGAAAGPLVAFGAGVNIVSKPENVDYPTARLLDFLGASAPPSPAEFVASLDAAMRGWLELWRQEGFPPVRAAWLENAANLGEKIRVRLPGETVEGMFIDLDQSGALVLDCETGRRLIAAGAVLPPARSS